MEKEQLSFVAYEVLLDRLELWMSEKGIKQKSEAVRTLVEYALDIDDYDREQYRESVKAARSGKVPNNKKKRKPLFREMKKKMEKDKYYSLTELSKLMEVSRRIIRDIVINRYPEHFDIKEESVRTVLIRKYSKSERERNKEIEERDMWKARISRQRKQDGLPPIKDWKEYIAENYKPAKKEKSQ